MIWCEKVRTMTAKQKGALIDAMTGAICRFHVVPKCFQFFFQIFEVKNRLA